MKKYSRNRSHRKSASRKKSKSVSEGKRRKAFKSLLPKNKKNNISDIPSEVPTFESYIGKSSTPKVKKRSKKINEANVAYYEGGYMNVIDLGEKSPKDVIKDLEKKGRFTIEEGDRPEEGVWMIYDNGFDIGMVVHDDTTRKVYILTDLSTDTFKKYLNEEYGSDVIEEDNDENLQLIEEYVDAVLSKMEDDEVIDSTQKDIISVAADHEISGIEDISIEIVPKIADIIYKAAKDQGMSIDPDNILAAAEDKEDMLFENKSGFMSKEEVLKKADVGKFGVRQVYLEGKYKDGSDYFEEFKSVKDALNDFEKNKSMYQADLDLDTIKVVAQYDDKKLQSNLLDLVNESSHEEEVIEEELKEGDRVVVIKDGPHKDHIGTITDKGDEIEVEMGSGKNKHTGKFKEDDLRHVIDDKTKRISEKFVKYRAKGKKKGGEQYKEEFASMKSMNSKLQRIESDLEEVQTYGEDEKGSEVKLKNKKVDEAASNIDRFGDIARNIGGETMFRELSMHMEEDVVKKVYDAIVDEYKSDGLNLENMVTGYNVRDKMIELFDLEIISLDILLNYFMLIPSSDELDRFLDKLVEEYVVNEDKGEEAKSIRKKLLNLKKNFPAKYAAVKSILGDVDEKDPEDIEAAISIVKKKLDLDDPETGYMKTYYKDFIPGINEDHMQTREEKEEFILKNQQEAGIKELYTEDDFIDVSDEEIDLLYQSVEDALSVDEAYKEGDIKAFRDTAKKSENVSDVSDIGKKDGIPWATYFTFHHDISGEDMEVAYHTEDREMYLIKRDGSEGEKYIELDLLKFDEILDKG